MAEENAEQPEEEILDKHDFFFEVPLYEFIETEKVEDIHDGDVDAYSAKNGIDTTYKIYSCPVNAQYESTFDNFYKIILTCKRKNNDVLRFFVYDDGKTTVKLGQYPSLADIQYAELGKKYDKVLPKEDLKNLKKAIGLVAHGAGAGSFVYLRRIFENLIDETYKQNAATVGIAEAEFKTKRMEDKIDLLKSFLPSQLVEMKSIYGILSKGVHELTEEECLKYFAPIKLSIELILDQKIEDAKKQERDTQVKQQLQGIHQELSTGKSK